MIKLVRLRDSSGLFSSSIHLALCSSSCLLAVPRTRSSDSTVYSASLNDPAAISSASLDICVFDSVIVFKSFLAACFEWCEYIREVRIRER